MALTYVSVGSTSTSTTQNYPTTVNAGDFLFWVVCSKYDPNFVTPDSTWALIHRATAGSGTGAGAGAITGAIYAKQALGTESAGTFTVTATSVNSFVGRVVQFSAAAGTTLDFQGGSGNYTGGTTAWSITTAESFAMMNGDAFVIFSAGNNFSPTYTGHAFTAVSGITLAAISEKADTGTSAGDDVKMVVATGAVTAGAAVSPLTYAMTGTAANLGVTIIARIREKTRKVILT